MWYRLTFYDFVTLCAVLAIKGIKFEYTMWYRLRETFCDFCDAMYGPGHERHRL